MANVLPFNPGERPFTYTSGNGYVAKDVIASTGPALLFGFHGYNSKASAQFIMIFDSATVPADTNGAQIILYVAATATFSWQSSTPGGRIFTNGITWSNSSTAPTKTLALADCWLSAEYAK